MSDQKRPLPWPDVAATLAPNPTTGEWSITLTFKSKFEAHDRFAQIVGPTGADELDTRDAVRRAGAAG